jgi:hypothetical protein
LLFINNNAIIIVNNRWILTTLTILENSSRILTIYSERDARLEQQLSAKQREIAGVKREIRQLDPQLLNEARPCDNSWFNSSAYLVSNVWNRSKVQTLTEQLKKLQKEEAGLQKKCDGSKRLVQAAQARHREAQAPFREAPVILPNDTVVIKPGRFERVKAAVSKIFYWFLSFFITPKVKPPAAPKITSAAPTQSSPDTKRMIVVFATTALQTGVDYSDKAVSFGEYLFNQLLCIESGILHNLTSQPGFTDNQFSIKFPHIRTIKLEKMPAEFPMKSILSKLGGQIVIGEEIKGVIDMKKGSITFEKGSVTLKALGYDIPLTQISILESDDLQLSIDTSNLGWAARKTIETASGKTLPEAVYTAPQQFVDLAELNLPK